MFNSVAQTCACTTVSNQKVILVECVLIRARKNLSASFDKGLGRGERARTLEGGREKDREKRKMRRDGDGQNLLLF